MKRSVIETILGGVVLLLAGTFLAFSYNTANIKKIDGYEIFANFTGIGGLGIGDQVQISGVKVGTVSAINLNPETYLATVKLDIDPNVKIPEDTVALISSESLLGGKYLELLPGGAEEMMEPGKTITQTQAPQNLEQLLGKFIFSMQNEDKGEGKAEEKSASAAAMPSLIDADETDTTEDTGTDESAQ